MIYKKLCDDVYNKLNSLVWTNINYIYNYDKSSFDEWIPAITVSPWLWTFTIADNVSYEMNVPIIVRIYTQSDILETEEDIIRMLTDQIIEAFYKDYTLMGEYVANNLNVSFWYTGEMVYRVVEISITYKKLLSL